MQFNYKEISSAKDNKRAPIHDWYKFTAGFSYRFVEQVIFQEDLINDENALIFDPFAGCGTTLVTAQKNGINAIGN